MANRTVAARSRGVRTVGVVVAALAVPAVLAPPSKGTDLRVAGVELAPASTAVTRDAASAPPPSTAPAAGATPARERAASASAAIAPASAPAPAAPVAGSRLIATSPRRMLDTRDGTGGVHRFSGGTTARLVVNRPDGFEGPSIAAIVANVTVVDAGAAGYLTMWPADAPRPATSTVNADSPGHTVANLSTVAVDATGTLSLFASVDMDVLVDVVGYYIPVASASTGRFVAVASRRLLDTRELGAPLAPGASRDIDLRDAGVPADASAALVTLTVAGSSHPGYWTAYPAKEARPTASNINVVRNDQIIANQAVVALRNRSLTVFSQAGGHLVVDLAGYFTGNSAVADTTGLFMPIVPYRLFDTRSNDAPPLPASGTVNGRPSLPSNVGAVVMNVTATDTAAPGYVTVYPADDERPATSNLNADRARQTVASAAVVGAGDRGFLAFTQSGGHLVADVVGYFRGTPRHGNAPLGASGSWTMLFHDGFDGAQLDESRWSPCFAHGDWSGCSNVPELQWYLPDQVRLGNGAVSLSASATPFQIDKNPDRYMSYRSGMISTLALRTGGAPHFTFTYGFAEMRAKLPAGAGMFPAFWLVAAQGTNEIDVVENLGHDPSTIYQTLHWSDSGRGNGTDMASVTGVPASVADGFHTYGLEWSPDRITWYVDGRVTHVVTSATAAIPAVPMGVIANLAVGGAWACSSKVPGPCPTSGAGDAQMVIDAIDVWQRA